MSSLARPVVTVGTRASALALTQTQMVADQLAAGTDLAVELVRITTEGDRLTGSLVNLGGTGVFVTALRDALLDGRCDVAVHSLKDLPTAHAPGLVIAAVPLRQDPRDALCARDGLTLADLPPGARVGTGSPRRAAQLLLARPDLVVVEIRGNVDTRLHRVAPGDLDAVVLAAAGLARLGRLDAVSELLDPAVMSPAPGQGALAVEARAADVADAGSPLALALAALDHAPTRLAVTAERALLARLEAGCAAPVGTHARLDGHSLALDAVVCRPDGTAALRRTLTTPLHAESDPARAGAHAAADPSGEQERLRAAARLGTDLADLLLADGAGELADLGPAR
ncbi:hydroxymethylbilane synthase [Pengzhenrongella frigida]|uniref:Porphobilinogen deaminase n=1 Tax=Pengzhenrongella frigida TaxID=1259133 RepID=A0A4Q5N1H4_9MICO|nr:hydroxymethylbilane synthase [Cellulomonas sp. HLT2-17]RYV51123.1 hydroxymethylbilane synthase [Cellulomonas sp. HLT2-17]